MSSILSKIPQEHAKNHHYLWSGSLKSCILAQKFIFSPSESVGIDHVNRIRVDSKDIKIKLQCERVKDLVFL